MNILHIDSSNLGERSASRALTRRVVDKLLRDNPGAVVQYRDLAHEALPQLSDAALGADAEATRSWGERADRLIAELSNADVVVVGVPLYNFSVPTSLKTWIDHVAVAGKTFSYSAEGPVGLLRDRPVILVGTAGGVHSHTPVHHAHVGYVERVLRFLGISDVRTVLAEGLAVPTLREPALAAAATRIDTQLFAQPVAAAA